MTGTGLTDLAAWAETRLPQVIDDAHAAIRSRIEVYRHDRPVPPEDLYGSIARNLHGVVDAIGHPQDSLDLAAPRDLGRRRAQQGVPLPEVMQADRISFATLWDALGEHGRRSRKPATGDTVLTAASRMSQLAEEHAAALTQAYREATADVLARQHRSALVEVLLTGRPGPDVGPWEAAVLLGLPPDGQMMVVAAEASDLAGESLPGIERRLAARGIVSGWRLTPALQLGVVSLNLDQRATVLAVLRDASRARAGVSPPYRSLADSPRALRLARTALATLPAGRPEVRMFSTSPLAALMACDPDEGRRLAGEVLGGVLEQAPDDRAILLETLNAYLDNDGSAERAAVFLYCHPNTVRYRLRRVHELTGRSLANPRGIAELATAAYALRLGAGGCSHIGPSGPCRRGPTA